MQHRIEESLFRQAKMVGETCTKQLNVIAQIFIWLQVLLTQGQVEVQESKVVRAAKSLSLYGGNIIPKEFLKSCLHSWQAYLQR